MSLSQPMRRNTAVQTGQLQSAIISTINISTPIINNTVADTIIHEGKPVTATLFNIVIPSAIFIPPQNIEYTIELHHLLPQFSQLLQLILELPNIFPV